MKVIYFLTFWFHCSHQSVTIFVFKENFLHVDYNTSMIRITGKLRNIIIPSVPLKSTQNNSADPCQTPHTAVSDKRHIPRHLIKVYTICITFIAFLYKIH